MSLVLYLGSDADQLPLIAPQDFTVVDSEDPNWCSKVVPFSVEELTDDNRVVATHFAAKTVRYAGSFEGCGCGFNACGLYEWDKTGTPDARVLAGRESRTSLRDYVVEHGVRQVYACWSGDETLPPTAHVSIGADRIVDWNFEIPERSMLDLTSS